MKISLNWLNDYVSLTGITADEISRAITFLGFEVESVHNTGAPKFNNVVVGRILTRAKHPNADKLSVCTVDVGTAGGASGNVKTIVCGAPNCDAGNLVPVALPGAILPGNFEIKQSKIRGHLSDGMMCSSKELALEGGDHSGLMILGSSGTGDSPVDGGKAAAPKQGVASNAPAPALGTPLNDILPPGDTVFDIEVTPNRPDCLSHLGIARELSAWFRKPLKYPEIKHRPVPDSGLRTPDAANTATLAAPNPNRSGSSPIQNPVSSEATGSTSKIQNFSVSVEDADACPLYTATPITGITIRPSPDWMQRRLIAAGLRPISNIVDISNYVMLEYGQPTHAFDAKKIAAHRINVRPAADGEKLITLDDKERTLNSRMLVIADAEKPLVIAGIMGGEDSGIHADTTDIILEAAIFARNSTRWTSKRLALSSDSSYRYERGVDPHTLPEAANRAISLILEHCGGQVAGPTHKAGGEAPWSREITITPAYINTRVGFEIPADDQRAALESLELRIVRETAGSSGTGDSPVGLGDMGDSPMLSEHGRVARATQPAQTHSPVWTVSIPSWRDDLDRPIDLVEEILRVHGTDKIPPAPVLAPTIIGNDDPIVLFNRAASAYLVGQGFNECVNYTLRSAKETETWASPAAAANLALLNPFIEDQSHLRPTLITGLLETLKLNQSRGVPATRLFETGRVFIEHNGSNYECVSVAFIISEPPANSAANRTWLKRAPADFYTTKRHLETLATAAGIDLSRQPVVQSGGSILLPTKGAGSSPHLANGWQENQSATLGEITHGWTARLGLLNLAMVRAQGIEGKVYAGTLSILTERIRPVADRRRYQPIAMTPAALRDIALIVNETLPAADVQKNLAKHARAALPPTFALESLAIFDVYQGKGLPEGTKSLAFTLTYRAPDRTLTDDEVNAAFTKLQESIAKHQPDWQIRK